MANYWQKRFSQLEEATNRYGQETYGQIEDTFNKAQAEMQKEIDVWYARLAKNNEISITEARKLLSKNELKEFHWDVEEYIKYGRENALNQKWMKELENASAKFHINRLEALKIRTQHIAEKAFGNEVDLVDKLVKKSYTENYYKSIYEVQKGFGVGFWVGEVDENKLSKLIAKPWAPDRKNFSSRIWDKKSQMVDELHKELTRTCILGGSPDKAIKKMSQFVDGRFKNAKAQAGRLVMTESAFFASTAKRESFNELGVEEFEVVATLDSHTSDICQTMDGKHFPMDQFEEGITAPPFHVWCRSTTCPYFKDEFTGEDLRAGRNEDGKVEYVPADMKYPEWKNRFVKKTLNFDDFDITENGKYEKIDSGKNLKVYLKRIEHEFSTQRLTVRELDHLWDKNVGYIQSQGYADINEFMRGLKPKLDNPQRRFTVNVLRRVTNNNALVQDYIGIRKVDTNYLNNVLGVDTSNLLKTASRKDGMGRFRRQLIPKDGHSAQKIVDSINSLIGTPKGLITDKAFTSVSMDESLNYFSHYPIKFEIQMDKGTKGLITNNLQESEFIIKDDSSIEIIGSKVYNDGGNDCILVYARVRQ